MLKLADAIEEHSDELVEPQSRNTGQIKALIASEEVKVGADQLRFFAGAARNIEGKATGEYMDGLSSSVRREPIGVVAQVTPWNYPLMMALWKIGPAIAAGNTVVLKPSDTTPESTVKLAEIADQILPPGVFNVVNGDGQTGKTLVEHPVPGLVSITGSIRAGISVAVSAAQQLKRAHLELGGKAPVVVFADADIEAAASGISLAGFFNAGQDCTAATRVIVAEKIHDQFVEALVAKAKETRPGDRDDEDAAYGPLNNASHFAKVCAIIAKLPDHATVATGGKQFGTEGFFFEPTVITGLQQEDQAIQEEIFGPVITVQPFTGRGGCAGQGQRGAVRPLLQRLDQGPRDGVANVPGPGLRLCLDQHPHPAGGGDAARGIRSVGLRQGLVRVRIGGLHPGQARDELTRMMVTPGTRSSIGSNYLVINRYVDILASDGVDRG